ncbi:toxin secretion/phage lysis holin [Thermaerobacter marianensis DSM 12885]|uniref:Toxin secretion/phage lysis holin n=1 Tax=Thermaerobacter marianensis (strain ATCC 700841 / DSM 12885 / JCM 10246 / 7p75a) TaxID=644966 RepID=E6SKJ5_THEM7|nr:phage holin family protein [Thermaerobacter marianensis]ADU50182.1 toxin secretion/phage lysis holin [Thermaerobacter marianensis DSM 12885]
MREDTIWTGAVALAGTVATAVFGAWDRPLQLLLVAMALDYVTGVVAAAVTGRLSSEVGLRGVARKLALLGLVAVANLIDQMLAAGAAQALDLALPEGTSAIRTAVCFALGVSEVVSIIENLGEAGAPIPEPLRRMVAALKRAEGGAEDGRA